MILNEYFFNYAQDKKAENNRNDQRIIAEIFSFIFMEL